jgi:hypothetical protein
MIKNTMTTNNKTLPKNSPAATLNNLRLISFYFYLIFSQKTGHGFYKNMQNKPNLNISKNTIIGASKMTYLQTTAWYVKKNKPNSNPIQTHSKPIQTQTKPIFSICSINHKQAFHLINLPRFGYASNIFFFLTGSQYESRFTLRPGTSVPRYS